MKSETIFGISVKFCVDRYIYRLYLTYFQEKMQKIQNIDIYVRFCNIVHRIHNFKDFAMIPSPNSPQLSNLQIIKLRGKREYHIFGIKLKIRKKIINFLEKF